MGVYFLQPGRLETREQDASMDGLWRGLFQVVNHPIPVV